MLAENQIASLLGAYMTGETIVAGGGENMGKVELPAELMAVRRRG